MPEILGHAIVVEQTVTFYDGNPDALCASEESWQELDVSYDKLPFYSYTDVMQIIRDCAGYKVYYA